MTNSRSVVADASDVNNGRCNVSRYGEDTVMRIRLKGLRALAEEDRAKLVPGHLLPKLRRVLALLDGAQHPGDLAQPAYRLHPLKGDMAGGVLRLGRPAVGRRRRLRARLRVLPRGVREGEGPRQRRVLHPALARPDHRERDRAGSRRGARSRLRFGRHVRAVGGVLSGVSGSHNEAKAAPPGAVTGRYGTLGEVFFVQDIGP